MSLQGRNFEADFKDNEYIVRFKQQLKELKKYGVQADRGANGTEGADEDMTVTKSQTC